MELTDEKLEKMVQLHKQIKELTEEYDKLKELVVEAWVARGAKGVVFACSSGVVSVKERYTPQYDFNKVTDLCGGDKDKLISVMALSNTKLKKAFSAEQLESCESDIKLSHIVSVAYTLPI